jgi:hypothetical protein
MQVVKKLALHLIASRLVIVDGVFWCKILFAVDVLVVGSLDSAPCAIHRSLVRGRR